MDFDYGMAAHLYMQYCNMGQLSGMTVNERLLY